MNKTFHLVAIVFLSAGLVTSPVFADVNKGQKIFIKIMKKPCGMNGGEMAKKHTQEEWKAIQDAGNLNEELLKQCPDAAPLKDSYVPHVYDFLYYYGSDSGNVPTC